MNVTWFTVKVKYTKQLDNGALKRVQESYLVHASTFGEAEEKIYKELGSIIRGEFHVTDISRTEVHDIFMYDDADVIYLAKVKYENFDADRQTSRKVTQTFLVTAGSVQQACQRINESLKTLLVDFEIPICKVSPLIEIFQ